MLCQEQNILKKFSTKNCSFPSTLHLIADPYHSIANNEGLVLLYSNDSLGHQLEHTFSGEYGFGHSVAMNARGDWVAISLPYPVNSSNGYVYIYRKEHGIWDLVSTLVGPWGFGKTITLTADGRKLFVLLTTADVNGKYLYRYDRNPNETFGPAPTVLYP